MNETTLRKRINVIITVIGVCMVVLLVRLFLLQVVKGEKYKRIASVNTVRTYTIPAPRGEIRDRNGRLLAYDTPRLNVCAVLEEIKDQEAFADTLSPLIGYSPEHIKKIMARYKDVPYQKFVIKPKVDTATMMKVAEIERDLPGLHFEVQPVREYPNADYACHLIGYVGEVTDEEMKNQPGYHLGDYIGKDGVEKVYDRELRGKNGERNVMVDALGKAIHMISEKKPIPGKTLYLTIDLELQKKMEDILRWHVRSLSTVSREPLAAAAVLMDPHNGEIIALASVPGYDPNLFSKGISTKDYSTLINRQDFPLLNRVISGAYPPASTYKIITGIAALEEGLCTRHSPFNCPGFYKVGNQRFNCFVTTGHHKIDFNNSMAQSCDVTFYILGEKLGNKRILEYSRKFGIGELTGIDLPGEIKGILPTEDWKKWNIKEPWFTGDTVNMAIGQGYLNVTPLQIAVATAAIAGNGTIVKPHLFRRVADDEGRILQEFTPQQTQVTGIRQAHYDAIQEGMRMAVQKGTATKLKKCTLSSAGKTGTAENCPSPENPHGRNHTWFTGYSPAWDPNVVIVVFFERSGNYAGNTVVPMSSEILDAYRQYRIRQGKR